jgi:hypothetical protein
MRGWKKYAGITMAALVILVLVVYAGDWLVLRYRMAQGTGFDAVEVDEFLATPLKGNKTEYDMVGSFQQPCTRSLFPQRGKPACWWVRRHNAVWE